MSDVDDPQGLLMFNWWVGRLGKGLLTGDTFGTSFRLFDGDEGELCGSEVFEDCSEISAVASTDFSSTSGHETSLLSFDGESFSPCRIPFPTRRSTRKAADFNKEWPPSDLIDLMETGVTARLSGWSMFERLDAKVGVIKCGDVEVFAILTAVTFLEMSFRRLECVDDIDIIRDQRNGVSNYTIYFHSPSLSCTERSGKLDGQ